MFYIMASIFGANIINPIIPATMQERATAPAEISFMSFAKG